MTLSALNSRGDLLCPAKEVLSHGPDSSAYTFSDNERKQNLYCYPCALRYFGDRVLRDSSLFEQLGHIDKHTLQVVPVNGARVRLRNGDEVLRLPSFRHVKVAASCGRENFGSTEHAVIIGLFAQLLKELYKADNLQEEIEVLSEPFLRMPGDEEVGWRSPDLLVTRLSRHPFVEPEPIEAAEVQISPIPNQLIVHRSEDLSRIAEPLTWFLYKPSFARRIPILQSALGVANLKEVRLYLFWNEGGRLYYESAPALENAKSVKRGQRQGLDECKQSLNQKTRAKEKLLWLSGLQLKAPVYLGGQDKRPSLPPASEVPEGEVVQLSIDLSDAELPQADVSIQPKRQRVRQKRASAHAFQYEIPKLWE